MSSSSIITMANQIARNLAHGHGDPATAVAQHINNFWDPRMRAQLLNMLEEQPDQFLDIVKAAQSQVHTPTNAI